MVIDDLISKLDLTVKVMPKDGHRRKVQGGYVGDVLSHVMAFCKPSYIWVTVQTHENVIAVASMLDVAAVLVSSREIPLETCKRAEEEGVVLLWSDKSAFELVGEIYQMLNS